MFLQRQVKAEIRKETLPTGHDIVEMKKLKIKDELAEIVENETYADYDEIARELLAELDPEVALAALMRLAFKNELDESNYPEIRRIDVNRRGTSRLFIGLGKSSGYRPKLIVELLARECGIPQQKIDDVKCMDDFSFATIPFQDAEAAMKKLNSLRELAQDDRPLAKLAKESEKQSDRNPNGVRDNGRNYRRGPRDSYQRRGGSQDYSKRRDHTRRKY